MMRHIIGLTGLIGSGKSLAGKVFQDIGIDVIDTDTIAHQVTAANGAAISTIAACFGKEYLTEEGALNRLKMRELVFSNPIERRRLERIVHPLIFSESLKIINQIGSSYVIIMVPLLFKSLKYLNLINRSIFIDCEESILIMRVMDRSNMTENQVRNVLKAQMPRSCQLNLCDDCLHNHGSIPDLTEQVIKLDKSYKKLFAPVKLKL